MFTIARIPGIGRIIRAAGKAWEKMRFLTAGDEGAVQNARK